MDNNFLKVTVMKKVLKALALIACLTYATTVKAKYVIAESEWMDSNQFATMMQLLEYKGCKRLGDIHISYPKSHTIPDYSVLYDCHQAFDYDAFLNHYESVEKRLGRDVELPQDIGLFL